MRLQVAAQLHLSSKLETARRGTARIAVLPRFLREVEFHLIGPLARLQEFPLQAEQVLFGALVEPGGRLLEVFEQTGEIVLHLTDDEDLEKVEEASLDEVARRIDGEHGKA